MSPTDEPSDNRFDEIVSALRRDGLDAHADGLHSLLHKTAWTTGSELLGELGLKLRAIEHENTGQLSADSRLRIKEANRIIKRTWPGLPW